MSVKTEMQQMGIAARRAAAEINRATTGQKNAALGAIAEEILKQRAFLMAENQKDLDAAKTNGISDAMLDPLMIPLVRLATWLISLVVFRLVRCACLWA